GPASRAGPTSRPPAKVFSSHKGIQPSVPKGLSCQGSSPETRSVRPNLDRVNALLPSEMEANTRSRALAAELGALAWPGTVPTDRATPTPRLSGFKEANNPPGFATPRAAGAPVPIVPASPAGGTAAPVGPVPTGVTKTASASTAPVKDR